MKIDQDLQTIFLSPVKCFIQFFNTSDEWFSVTENEIWNRDSYCIHSHGFNSCEVSFCNVLRTMDLDSCFIDLFGELCGQIVFIFCCCAIKQRRTHPFFKYQPVSKIDSFYFHVFLPDIGINFTFPETSFRYQFTFARSLFFSHYFIGENGNFIL